MVRWLLSYKFSKDRYIFRVGTTLELDWKYQFFVSTRTSKSKLVVCYFEMRYFRDEDFFVFFFIFGIHLSQLLLFGLKVVSVLASRLFLDETESWILIPGIWIQIFQIYIKENAEILVSTGDFYLWDFFVPTRLS